jgi:hypothetical protein
MAWDSRIILAGQQYTGPDPIQTVRTMADLARNQHAMGIAERELELRGGQVRAQSAKTHQDMIREQAEMLARPLRGVKDQAGLDAAFLSYRQAGIPDELLAQLPREYNDQTAPIFKSIASMGISSERQAQMEQEDERFEEVKRHNKAMESRPSAGAFPAPIIMMDQSGNPMFVAPPRIAPGSPAVPAVGPDGKPLVPKSSAGAKLKPLTKGDTDRLEELRGQKDSFTELGATFKREFAGGGPLGTAAVAKDAVMGSLASKEGQERAAWWANFAKWVDLPERNKTFGASLSAGEKASWESAKNIKPGNDPELIEKQIKKMNEVIDAVAKRRGRSLAKGGYSLESIEEYTGPLGLDGAAGGGNPEFPGLSPEEIEQAKQLRAKGLL